MILLLLALLSAAWMLLHWTLGRQRFWKILAATVVIELIGFFALWNEVARQSGHDDSGAMAAGIIVYYFGVPFLVLPALVGAVALWKYRRMAAEKEQGIR